ncbi:hypothetical protein HYH03_003869 [Edaphochlamys debaryana]|uniref:Dienelactone hydrolase domain-containing protein n=1 Tax=Edaphochlamys debaryana TaxID=47281 RepID=A0A835YC48_9CHLO|nr:hypothetical protein HYH03_003869 [Edaphochlamys debaryana]|eukprot:KAG2498111.1 hypothetical protein HYH03_003869 [Edaphochlamys debaryana]
MLARRSLAQPTCRSRHGRAAGHSLTKPQRPGLQSNTTSTNTRPTLPPPPALPDTADLNPAITTAGAVLLGLPASVALDELLDTLSPRVDCLANSTTAGGVKLFVARPPSGGAAPAGGKRPGVILIHQILGLQQRECDLATALAAEEGVVAVAPDTFKGQSTLWPFRAITLGFKYALRPGTSWGAESVHEAVQWLKAQPDVDPDRIVVAGFCYGGGSAVRYAAAYPGEAAGVCIFYGRPLLEASEVAKLGRTPVLGLYGTRDSQFPKDMLDKFQADLIAAEVPARLELFEGEGHAFVKDVGAVRQGGSAGRAWALFRDFVRSVAGAPAIAR